MLGIPTILLSSDTLSSVSVYWAAMEIPNSMTCPTCYSHDLRRLSLVYAEGVRDNRGRSVGWLLGSGVWFVRHWGTSESRLSEMLRPPRKCPYGWPIFLWFLILFPFMAFIGRGKLSWTMGLLATMYFFLLPALRSPPSSTTFSSIRESTRGGMLHSSANAAAHFSHLTFLAAPFRPLSHASLLRPQAPLAACLKLPTSYRRFLAVRTL